MMTVTEQGKLNTKIKHGNTKTTIRDANCTIGMT